MTSLRLATSLPSSIIHPSCPHRLATSLPPSIIHPSCHHLNGLTRCHPSSCSIIAHYAMTTIDLLQRYPPHKDSIHHGKAPDSTKPSNSKKPDPTMPDLGASQIFDAKTEVLYELLDEAVKYLANSQPEPASEYEGTFWTSPLGPRSRSPAYSEISDSFESPSRIEHCTNDLLSTPMSPMSAHFKGPDGYPLGVEVAMNDFHRGRLSTPSLQENELPNRLLLRKPKQQRPCTDLECVSTLSARKYGDNQDSLVNASSELHPALAQGKLPIGPGSESAGLELSILKFGSEGCDKSHIQTDGTRLLNKDTPQTGLSDSPPHNKEVHEHAHQAEPRNKALADAQDENTNLSKALDPCEYAKVKSVDREIGCQNTSDDRENNTFQGIGPLTSEDSGTDGDSRVFFWKTSGPLEDILEESEDTPTSTLTLDRGQPQHSTPGTAESLDCQMLAFPKPQTESFTLSSPPRVPSSSKLTINPSSRAESESSRYSSLGAMSSELTLSAATMAELKDPARKKGILSAAALAEMRKTAESQAHFRTGPSLLQDQSQAKIHPLLRSKSHSRPSFQARKIVKDSPLKYVFEDDDSEGHESDEGDNSSHQITLKPRSQSEAGDTESVVTQIAIKENPSSQLGMMMKDTESRYPFNDNGMDSHEAEYARALPPRTSTLRSSNDTTLVPSLENALASSSRVSTSPSEMSGLSVSGDRSPDVMSSSIFQPSTSPSTTGYYPNLGIGSPAKFNSWASTPHSHEHGHCSSTPSSALTHPTSTVPTPSSTFNSNLSTTRGTTMTPSSSFRDFTGSKTHRRSSSVSSMLARFHNARAPNLPTAPMNDSTFSLEKSTEGDQARDDPFTSTHDTFPPSSFNLKAPSKETLADTQTAGADKFNTPTRRSSNRFSLHRRSLSTSGRPKLNEGIERALTSMTFDPHRARLHKRNNSTSASITTPATPDGSGPGNRRSLSIAATTTIEQKWEVAPPPTPIALRDSFSMRYRAEPLEADDHYASRKDAPQGMKQGLKKVFGRK